MKLYCQLQRQNRPTARLLPPVIGYFDLRARYLHFLSTYLHNSRGSTSVVHRTTVLTEVKIGLQCWINLYILESHQIHRSYVTLNANESLIEMVIADKVVGSFHLSLSTHLFTSKTRRGGRVEGKYCISTILHIIS